jgi:hypothetical protein
MIGKNFCSSLPYLPYLPYPPTSLLPLLAFTRHFRVDRLIVFGRRPYFWALREDGISKTYLFYHWSIA